MRTPCRSAVAASPSVVARQTTRTSCPRATSRDDCSQSIRVPPPSAGVGETSETMRTRSFALTRRSPERPYAPRSEEHTSELQSPCNLVCRLLLEKKKKIKTEKHDTPMKSDTVT